MKKSVQYILAMCLIVFGMIAPIDKANGQEELVKFNLDLSIVLNGGQAIPQSQYSFDIIERDENQQPFEGANIYKYSSSDPNQSEDIYLAPGFYTFRLYDGSAQPFVREGLALEAASVKQTNEQVDPDQPIVDALNQGAFNDWGNGTVVYDVNFQVRPGPGLIDPSTDQASMTLQIVLADKDSVLEVTNDSEVTPDIPSEESLVPFAFVVTDQYGQPVEGVVIQINEASGVTDESGQVTIESPAGSQMISITQVPEGYIGISEYDPLPINEEPNQPIALNIQKEENMSSITFRAIDEQGQAIPGVSLQVLDQELVTDQEGIVQFDQIPAGTQTYTISSYPEGYHIDETSGQVEVSVGQVQEIALVFSPVQEEGSAVVQVYNQDQEPLAGLGITIQEVEYISDVNGQIILEELPAKDHAYTVTTLPEGYQQPEEGMITILAGQKTESTLVVERLVNEGQVSLQVIDQDGAPVSQAEIMFEDYPQITNDLGLVELKELPAGNYNYQLTSLPEGYTGQASDVMTVEENQKTEAIIQVEKQGLPGHVQIQVIDQEQHPVLGAQVVLGNQGSTTDENGYVYFSDVEVGTQTYEITELPSNYSHNLQAQRIEVKEGQSLERLMKVTKEIPKRQLTIYVLDQNDEPVKDVKVSVGDKEVTTDNQGQALIKEMKPGLYDFKVTQLPKDYLNAKEGQVNIPETEDASLAIYIEKDIKPANASLTIYDQNQEGVPGVTIQFGGLTGASNADGQVIFKEISPGTYNYSILEVPEGYDFEEILDSVSLKEEDNQSLELSVYKQPEQGNVKAIVTDDTGRTIPGVTVKLSGKEMKTDKKGEVAFEAVNVGQVTVEIVNVPAGYTLNKASQTLNIENKKTKEVNLSIKTEETTQTETTTVTTTAESTTKEETTSQTSVTTAETTEATTTRQVPHIKEVQLNAEQEKEVDSQAQQATRQFVDANTGIEIWVNPQDAQSAVKLAVEKLDINSYQSLQSMDSDGYKLTLLDKNNEAIQLTRIAEVKIPTRPVNSQIKVLRLDQEDELSSLTFALHNRKVTYRTQELGSFAITYGSKPVSQVQESSDKTSASTIEVNKTKSVQKKDDLPNTGESAGKFIIALGIILLATGTYILFKSKHSKNMK